MSLAYGSPARQPPFPPQRLAQLEAVYASVPVGLCLVDRELRIVSTNPRFVSIFPPATQTHLAERSAEYVSLPEKLELALQRAVAGEPEPDVEFSLPLPDGSVGDYLGKFAFARNDDGEVMGVALAVIEITQHKRAEAALRESEESFRNHVELGPRIPWTARPDGALVEVSPRWEALSGFHAEETLGRGWENAIHDDDLEELRRAYENGIRHGESFRCDFRIRCKDSTERWIGLHAAPRRDVRGDIVCWYGSFDDINESKLAQAALTEASRLLDVSAREDYLTRLPNRRALDEALAREAGRAARTRTPLAVVMLDVDWFKSFNDWYGHIEGDRCLAAIALALKSAITRPDDLVARYGGEEFAIVLPDTDVHGAMHVAERAASAVRALRLVHEGVPLGIVTLSAGVAVVEPSPEPEAAPDDCASRVLRDADRALYVAKASGRNLVVLGSSTSPPHV